MILVVIAQTDSISKNSSSIVEINTGITLVIPNGHASCKRKG